MVKELYFYVNNNIFFYNKKFKINNLLINNIKMYKEIGEHIRQTDILYIDIYDKHEEFGQSNKYVLFN